MKFKKTLVKPWQKFTGFISVFIFIFFAWIINLSPKSISDVNVQLSLFAMEKGYQGVTIMNSNERSYTPADYFKKIIFSPLNLRHASIEPIPSIYLDLPLEEYSKLRTEINKSLNYKASNQREKQNLAGNISSSIYENIDVEVNLKGNGLDHVMYKNKESIRIETTKENFNGLSEFSLQHPLVRDFQLEALFMHVSKHYEIIATHLELRKLYVNGKNNGIFLLEEVGTKEHLEKNNRVNSVVIRFNAPRYRELIGTNVAYYGRNVNYRTSPIDSLNTSKIKNNPELSKFEKQAKGLLRSFLDGNSPAEKVFDPVLMGRYLGIAEVFGAIHPLIFHNYLFYYNPDTMKLEPIAYDASLHQRYVSNVKVSNLTDGFTEELLKNEFIFKNYQETIFDLSSKLIEDGKLIKELKEIDSQWHSQLVKEFWLLENVNFTDLIIRSNKFLEQKIDTDASSGKKYLKQRFTNPDCELNLDQRNRASVKSLINENKVQFVVSEYYFKSDCLVLKIWTTSFDQPEVYENLDLESIEIGLITDETLTVRVDEILTLEVSSQRNPNFPSIPNYKVLILPKYDIQYIKVIYRDILSGEKVFTISEEIQLP